MVQERNVIERAKVQERDLDRSPRFSGASNGGRDSSSTTDVASGLALVLSTLAFFFSSIAVIQGVRARREVQALNSPASQVAPSPASNGIFAGLGNRQSAAAKRVEPGQFVQPAYNGDGQVELLSVERVDASGNVVNVQMRVRRLRDQVQGVGDIDLAKARAINSRTNESYPTLNFQSPFGNALSLYDIRPNQSVDVSLAVRVPEKLNRIDLEIPKTNLFRGVPIAVPAGSAAQ